MSIETAAKDLASELSRQEYVEILCHHDADGIAAGSIMATALFRARIQFRLRVIHRLSEQNLPKNRPVLLCDLGAGMSSLPEDIMVIDHHVPFFEGPYHVNPRLDGIDGDTDLSAAGTAYLVADALGDNRDIAGLFLLGVLGDRQKLTGKNQEIYLDAVGNGMIRKKRGIRLPGRSYTEKVVLATVPFITGISGSEEEAEKTVLAATDNGNTSLDLLCSLLVMNAAERSQAEVLMNLWGDCWQLEREILEDAHTMTYVIDACGKAGAGSTAASVCFRSSSQIPSAYDIAKSHRMALIQEMNRYFSSLPTDETGSFACSNLHLVSDVADTIYQNIPEKSPVIVTSLKEDGSCMCSIRTRNCMGRTLGEIVHDLAGECDGSGGGHLNRAGATIAGEHLKKFISGISEVCG